MERLGIISGAYELRRRCFNGCEERRMENEFGTTVVYVGERAVFLPRHGRPQEGHILPHLINHRANLKALEDLGVKKIFALNSVGSLKADLLPGTFVIPDDFIALNPPGIATAKTGSEAHIVCTLSDPVRREILAAVQSAGIEVVPTGVYWQTPGPRFETKAEIRLMARFADIVGMTMASEAVAASERGIPYGALCSVDNYANGVGTGELKGEHIALAARGQLDRLVTIIESYRESFPAGR